MLMDHKSYEDMRRFLPQHAVICLLLQKSDPLLEEGYSERGSLRFTIIPLSLTTVL
jgi:hypothetical protein